MADQIGFNLSEFVAERDGRPITITPGPGGVVAATVEAGRLIQFEIDCQVICSFCAAVVAVGHAHEAGVRYGPAVLADESDPGGGYCHPAIKPAVFSVWCDATLLRSAWAEGHGGGEVVTDAEQPAASLELESAGADSDSDGGL